MSANLELVRSIFADFERGDYTSAEWADAEIEYAWPDGPEPGSATGPAAMAEAMRGFLGAWADWRVIADEHRELDAERGLVLQYSRARGKASGVNLGEMRAEGANLFHILDVETYRRSGARSAAPRR